MALLVTFLSVRLFVTDLVSFTTDSSHRSVFFSWKFTFIGRGKDIPSYCFTWKSTLINVESNILSRSSILPHHCFNRYRIFVRTFHSRTPHECYFLEILESPIHRCQHRPGPLMLVFFKCLRNFHVPALWSNRSERYVITSNFFRIYPTWSGWELFGHKV